MVGGWVRALEHRSVWAKQFSENKCFSFFTIVLLMPLKSGTWYNLSRKYSSWGAGNLGRPVKALFSSVLLTKSSLKGRFPGM